MQTSSLRDELLARAEALKVLPTLNTVIDEVLQVIADDNASFKQLFAVIKYDQAISSKIISIANSAYFSRGAQIGNLERAMVAVGFDEIKKIVMCLLFLKEMANQWKLSQEDLAILWTHTISVACAARVLAGKTMSEDVEKVFTVSIVHDIGKVAFFMYGDQYRKLAEEARCTGRDICSLEREAFGIDHQEVGYFMSVKWRFPEEFTAVIRGHHQRTGTPDPLVGLVAKADRFIDNPGADLGTEGIILRGEASLIVDETKRISELLGVA
jgi:putative nucleotidyltransferase with HDIG domain